MTGVQEWVRQTVMVCRAPRGGEVLLSLSYPELSLSLEQLSHHRALEQRRTQEGGSTSPCHARSGATNAVFTRK